MKPTLDQVREAALTLAEHDRAELIYDLIGSMTLMMDFSDYQAHVAEALTARMEAYKRGEVEAIDAFEAIRQLREKLAANRRDLESESTRS